MHREKTNNLVSHYIHCLIEAISPDHSGTFSAYKLAVLQARRAHILGCPGEGAPC